MKKVIVFGSTGSIGKSALGVIRKSPSKFKILGLCVNKDEKTLYEQAKEFKPAYLCIRDEKSAKKLQGKLPKGVKLFKGESGLLEFAAIKSDISLMAISGISSLKPLLASIESAKRIALANKEAIVAAGDLVFKKAKKFNTEILPVDSEINALFQLIRQGKENLDGFLRKVHITASGGALAGYKKRDLAKVSVKKVLSHPTWSMGKRITVDSATLVNKGFEVIETHRFFNIPYKKIGIVLHKESAIHALIQLRDNILFACIYPPDMKLPISHALCYPERFKDKVKNNFKGNFSYNFKPINYKDYPLLKVILEAAKREDNSLTILNACDEVAIDYFLRKKIKFIDIYKVMECIFRRYPSSKTRRVRDVFYWDNWARNRTKEYLEKL